MPRGTGMPSVWFLAWPLSIPLKFWTKPKLSQLIPNCVLHGQKRGKDSPKRGEPLLGISPWVVLHTQAVEAGKKSGTAGTPAEKNDRYKPIANRQGDFPCLFAAEGSVIALEFERQNRDVVVVSVNMPHFRRSGNFLGDFLGGKGTVQLQFRQDPVISRHSGPVGD